MTDATIKLRKEFLQKYMISKINIFEEAVFDNVAITVCAFQFKKKQKKVKQMSKVVIYPQQKINTHDFTKYFALPKILIEENKEIQVRRGITSSAMQETKILINCVDNVNEKIGAKIITSEISPKKSSRHNFIAYVNRSLSIKEQQIIVSLFNKKLMDIRIQYGSLILPYFLGFGRKRLPFI